MSELISGKEALIALVSGSDVEFEVPSLNKWICMKSEPWDLNIIIEDKYNHKFRLKPKTITINNIEVPAPFEPKEGDMVWCLNELSEKGYEARTAYDSNDFTAHIAYWRTEDEIKQVVSALRSIFKGEM